MRGRGTSWWRPRLRSGKHRRETNQGVSLIGFTTQSTGGIASTGVCLVDPEEATRGRDAAGPFLGRLPERMLVRERGEEGASCSVPEFHHSRFFVTRSSNLIMVSAAARKFALSERRDQMVLVMASHAARVKVKARQAKDEAVRQVHRTERYQQFKGRRSTALDEGGHARRARRVQAMLLWLEAQALANAQEGSPREIHANGRPMDVEIQEDCEAGEEAAEAMGGKVLDDSQRLITSFFGVTR